MCRFNAGLCVRYQAAGSRDDAMNFREEEVRTPHDSPCQSDHVRTEDFHNVGQAVSEIVGFAVDGLTGEQVALAGQTTDILRSQVTLRGTGGGYLEFHPFRHGWTGGENLPAATLAAITRWPGSINNLMSNIGMEAIDAAIEFAVKNNPHADSSAYRHINEMAFPPSAAPACFRQRGGIGVIFHGYIDLEPLTKLLNQILGFPPRQELH